jgi:hypothetical protein
MAFPPVIGYGKPFKITLEQAQGFSLAKVNLFR